MISRGLGNWVRPDAAFSSSSSRMMSLQSSTHSSQMNTLGPAISLRTSCWLLPQNEQYRILPPSLPRLGRSSLISCSVDQSCDASWGIPEDRKSTRLNSSHPSISYAVFCLKKKKYKIRKNNYMNHIL